MLCHAFDGIDGLAMGDVEVGEPGPGEVRVEVGAVGVNFADTLVLKGEYQTRPAFPFSPGFECAGRISAIGTGCR